MVIHRILPLAVVLSCGAAATALGQIPPLQWVEPFSGPAILRNTIVVNPDDDCLVAGSFTEETDFGGVILTPQGQNDIFVAKYDDTGDLVWAVQAGGVQTPGGNHDDWAEGIDLDASGNILVTGTFSDTGHFDAMMVVSAGLEDVFTAKCDPAGAFQWVRRGGGAGVDEGRDIAARGDGTSYVVGTFRASADFEDTTLVTVSGSEILSDAFLVKYAPDGQFVWARQFAALDGDSQARGLSVDLDPSGHCVVSGWFDGNVAIGDSTFFDDSSAFLAEFDASGAFQWATNLGPSFAHNDVPVAVDGGGNVYTSGAFLNNPAAAFSMFTAKYDDQGQLVWYDLVDDFLADFEIPDMAVDANGNTYTIGALGGTATFGSTVLSSVSNDMFLAVRDPDGNFLAAMQGGGYSDQGGLSVALGSAGRVFATGYGYYGVDFGDSVLTFPDNFGRLFLAEFDDTPTGLDSPALDDAAVRVLQNVPNPFNPGTTIQYELPEALAVDLVVYDAAGRLVRTLVSSQQSAGPHSVFWDATDQRGEEASAGVYYYRLRAGATIEVRKMVIIK